LSASLVLVQGRTTENIHKAEIRTQILLLNIESDLLN